MKFIPNLLSRIETKTKHDLMKAIVSTIAAFAVKAVVENAYDSAFELKTDDVTTSTD
jgi:hypothetical protein